MTTGRGGEECEATMHLIKTQSLPMLHALLIIGITARYIERLERILSDAVWLGDRYVTKDSESLT